MVIIATPSGIDTPATAQTFGTGGPAKSVADAADALVAAQLGDSGRKR